MDDSFPSHIKSLMENFREVLELVDIQNEKPLIGAQYKHRIEILNKSGIIFLVATWEAFIEDLAVNAFNFLYSKAKDPSVFPKRVLTLAIKEICADNDRSKLWQLSGDGWKQILQDHKQVVFKEYIGKLNTPRPKQIDGLFEGLVGLPNVTAHWKWKGMSNPRIKKHLEDLVSLRGEISHRVKSSQKVRKIKIREDARFIGRLAVILSNRVALYLHGRVNEEPWVRMRFAKTE